MEKKGFIFLLMFFLLFNSALVSSKNVEDVRLIVVPTDDYYLTFAAHMVIDVFESNGDLPQFNQFLKDRGFEEGVEDPDFQKIIYSDESAELVFEFSTAQQISVFEEMSEMELDTLTVPSEINAFWKMRHELVNELHGDNPPELIFELSPYLKDGMFSAWSPEEIRKVLRDSDEYELLKRGFNLDNRANSESLSESEKTELREFKVWLSDSQIDGSLTSDELKLFTRLRVLEGEITFFLGDGRTDKDFEKIRRRRVKETLAESGVVFDPGKDVLVEFNGFRKASHAGHTSFQGDYIVLYNNRGQSILNSDILAHELHHIGIGGEYYCDEYNYKNWYNQDKALKIILDGKGCTNEYDPLGCCADNPLFWEAGPFEGEKVGFRMDWYESNLQEKGISYHCLPESTSENEYCEEVTRLSFVPFRLGQDYTCVGNPCETGDPGPPYCRSIMGPSLGKETINECFEGELIKKTPPSKDSSSSTTRSPSQQK